MARYDFVSDNTAPIAPEAMAALVAANAGFVPSYGEDPVTARAGDLIRSFLDADAEVRFVASGTAANAICVAALCRPFESVLAHGHAHLAIDETGAPSFFGHGLGIRGLPGASGRIDGAALAEALAESDSAHVQSPGALSMTNATEYGAVYSVEALRALIAPAKAKGLGIHLDGALIRHAAHANAMAARLAERIPFKLNHAVESNGLFVEMDEPTRLRLHGAGWASSRFLDGSVRFMCSWATTAEAVDELGAALNAL
jgi:threonine aldolase